MAAFTAQNLLDAAKNRYGTDSLRRRMRGAQPTDASTDQTQADAELLAIAAAVLGRVESATRAIGVWPFPTPYDATWPAELLQRALELFNWWTLSQVERVSEHAIRIGMAAEKWFSDLAAGLIELFLGDDAVELLTAEISAARDRTGAALIAGVSDRANVLETLEGVGWDRA